MPPHAAASRTRPAAGAASGPSSPIDAMTPEEEAAAPSVGPSPSTSTGRASRGGVLAHTAASAARAVDARRSAVPSPVRTAGVGGIGGGAYPAPPPPVPGAHTAAAAARRRAASQAPRTAASSDPRGVGAAAAAGGGGEGAPASPGEAELTFHPRITPLPPQYGVTAQRVLSSVPFAGALRHLACIALCAMVWRLRECAVRLHADRAVAWARHKAEEMARLEKEAREREVDGCTFTPAINPSSRTIATHHTSTSALAAAWRRPRLLLSRCGTVPTTRSLSIAGHHSHGANTSSIAFDGGGASVHDRLYAVSTRSRTPGRVGRPSTAGSMTGGGGGGGATDARSRTGRSRGSSAVRYLRDGRPLFTSAATGSPRHGQPLVLGDEERPLTREEAEVMRECTFRPKINTGYVAQPVRSK